MAKTARALQAEVNAWLNADGGFLPGATTKVGLYITAPTSPNPVLLSELGLPTPPNYPAVIPDHISDPVLRNDGRWTVVFSGIEWTGDADQLPITFLGFYVFDTTEPTKLIYWRAFDQPVVFLNVESRVDIIVRISTSNPADNVEVTVANG